MKRIFSLFVLIAICFAYIPISVTAEDSQQESFVSLFPTDDTYINNRDPNSPFGAATTMMAIPFSRRAYAFVRYDASEIVEEVQSASKIEFKYYGGTQERCNRVRLFPLYGGLKEFDEDTLCWTLASRITDGGSALNSEPDYSTEIFKSEQAGPDAKWHQIDVTDYVKSQSDYIYAFKIYAETEGSQQANPTRTKECVGYEPQLIIYTDINSKIQAAVDSIEKSAFLAKLTEDVELPSTYMGCDISWESNDENIITNDGKIAERPSSNLGENLSTTMKVGVSYKGKTVHKTLDVNVLAKNIVAASGGGYVAGGSLYNKQFCEEKEYNVSSGDLGELDKSAYVYFSEINENAEAVNAEKVLLRVFTDNRRFFQNGMVRTYGLEGNVAAIGEPFDKSIENELTATELIDEKQAGQSAYIDFDVSKYVCEADKEAFGFLLESDDPVTLFSDNSSKGPQLIFLSDSETRAYDILNSVRIENTDSIESDLPLVFETGGVEITYNSGDEALVSDTGEIYRPSYDEGDKSVNMTASCMVDGCTQKRELIFNIKKLPADGVMGYRNLKDPQKTSDEEFFGKFNNETGKWFPKPVLQYARYPGLSNVRKYAEEGNYSAAKNALFEYYKNKDKKFVADVAPSINTSLNASLKKDNIIGNMSAAGEGIITEEACWNSIDVTRGGKVEAGYLIVSRSKNGETAYFYSREAGYTPYLEVMADGKKYVLEATADTYLQAGEYENTNFGKESMLLVHEEEMPIGTHTQRTVLNFDVSVLDEVHNITSITLNIYGCKNGGTSDEMNVIAFLAPVLSYMDEENIVWTDHTPGAFVLTDTVYDWKIIKGTEYEWICNITRLQVNTNFVSYYLSSGDLDYAFRALENINTIDEYQVAEYPRNLDTGIRAIHITNTITNLYDCPLMTADLLTGLLKYVSREMEYLRTTTNTVVNQILTIKSGYFVLVSFFDELAADGYYNDAKNQFNNYLATAVHNDGSYVEATSGYSGTVMEDIQYVLDAAERFEGKYPEYPLDVYRKLAKYHMDITMPNGYIIPYGDNSRTNYRDDAKNASKWLGGDDELDYVATEGAKGKKPDHDSVLYPDKLITIMRDGWDNDNYFAFFPSEYGSSHGHPDDLILEVTALGRSLLTDGGNGGGYNPALPSHYVRTETYAHNTVEVDGVAQSNKVGVNDMSLTTNALFDYAKGYTDNSTGTKHTREVFFVKGSHWIVSDYLVPEDDEIHSYKQLWHPDNFNNLEIVEDSKAIKTHFEGTANIQVVPADPETLEAVEDKSFIRSVDLINLYEPYVYYRKTQEGTTTYDTLLLPTKQGDNDDAKVERLVLSDNAQTDTASAIMLDLRNKYGIYYLSHEEDEYKERSFDRYTFAGKIAYIERNTEDEITFIAMKDGSKITGRSGDDVIIANKNISDIAIELNSSNVEISSQEPVNSKITFLSNKKVKHISYNGLDVYFEQKGNFVTTDLSEHQLDTVFDGADKVSVLNEKLSISVPLSVGDTTKNALLEIPEGTEVRSSTAWNGKIDFNAKIDNGKLVCSLNDDVQISFAPFALITLPFYDDINAYYTVEGQRHDFVKELCDKNATIGMSQSGESSIIQTTTGGEFCLVKLIGANVSSNSGKSIGSGGAGGSGKTSLGGNFAQTADSNTATKNNFRLKDISGHWAEESICKLNEMGIVQGDENGYFNPENSITRAEFTVMIVRMAGIKCNNYNGDFTDVNADDWYADAVKTAAGSGIICGYDDKSFLPNKNITREEMAKILILMYKMLRPDDVLHEADITGFSDYGEVSAWAAGYLSKCFGKGLMTGMTEEVISPKTNCTRAQAATVVNRLVNLLK